MNQSRRGVRRIRAGGTTSFRADERGSAIRLTIIPAATTYARFAALKSFHDQVSQPRSAAPIRSPDPQPPVGNPTHESESKILKTARRIPRSRIIAHPTTIHNHRPRNHDPDSTTIRDPRSLCDPRSSILLPRSTIRDPRSSPLDPRSAILDPPPSILDPRSSPHPPSPRTLHRRRDAVDTEEQCLAQKIALAGAGAPVAADQLHLQKV